MKKQTSRRSTTSKSKPAVLKKKNPAGYMEDYRLPVAEPYNPADDEGLTQEQIREKWLTTATPDTFPRLTRDDIQEKAIDYERRHYITSSYRHSISRVHPRDTTSGVYPGASEDFHRRVAEAALQGDTPTNIAIELLVEGQPWRQALSAHPDHQQPVSTYGALQLPESRDPVALIEQDNPEPEPRPKHWEPGTPLPLIMSGALHDFGNYLTAILARQVVAIGFTPDTESIDNAASLVRTLKDFHKIYEKELERTAAKPRRYSPGRPRKRSHLDPGKALTLRVELVKKNKKFQNKKYADITLAESVAETEINSAELHLEERAATPAESAAEAEINSTQLPPSAETS